MSRILSSALLTFALGGLAFVTTPDTAVAGESEGGKKDEGDDEDHAVLTVTVHSQEGESVHLPREVAEFGKPVDLTFEQDGKTHSLHLSAERLDKHKARLHVNYEAGGDKLLKKASKIVALPGVAHYATPDETTLIDVKVRVHHDVKLDFGDDPLG